MSDRSYIIKVVTFQLNEVSFYVSDPLPEYLLAKKSIDRVGVTARSPPLYFKVLLLFLQFLLEVFHVLFLDLHLMSKMRKNTPRVVFHFLVFHNTRD